MHRNQHRLMSVVATTVAALALATAPAFAGSDGCPDDSDCRPAAQSPALVPAVPTPAPVASAPTTGDTSKPTSSKPAAERTVTRQAHVVTVAQRTVPRGAVAAGAGGTAPDSSGDVVLVLASGALLLLVGGASVTIAAVRRAS